MLIYNLLTSPNANRHAFHQNPYLETATFPTPWLSIHPMQRWLQQNSTQTQRISTALLCYGIPSWQSIFPSRVKFSPYNIIRENCWVSNIQNGCQWTSQILNNFPSLLVVQISCRRMFKKIKIKRYFDNLTLLKKRGSKGICLESRYPCCTCSSDFKFPLAVGAYGSPATIDPTLDLCTRYTHYGWVDRGSVEYEVCNALSTWPRAPPKKRQKKRQYMFHSVEYIAFHKTTYW